MRGSDIDLVVFRSGTIGGVCRYAFMRDMAEPRGVSRKSEMETEYRILLGSHRKSSLLS